MRGDMPAVLLELLPAGFLQLVRDGAQAGLLAQLPHGSRQRGLGPLDAAARQVERGR